MPFRYSLFSFHCQQAAEKYLKCLLTYLGIQTSRTHDLKALVALVPAEQRLSLRIKDIVELNPHAVDIRYADDWREPELPRFSISLLVLRFAWLGLGG